MNLFTNIQKLQNSYTSISEVHTKPNSFSDSTVRRQLEFDQQSGLRFKSPGVVSASFGQAGQEVSVGSPGLSLGVGDCTVLLSQVEPQLALVSEVEVTFLTLQRDRKGKK